MEGVVWMEELDSPFYAKHLGGDCLGSKGTFEWLDNSMKT